MGTRTNRSRGTGCPNGMDAHAYDPCMATFYGADGTRLAYRQAGEGDPLICLPGGPMQASAYLGDLGGLSACRWLVLLDLRGTGESAVPATRRPTGVIGRSRMSKRCACTLGWTEWIWPDTPPVRRWPCCTPPGTPTAL